MEKWNKQAEEELIFLIKDWLKQKGKTQKDLCMKLNSSSERISNLIEILKGEYYAGGFPRCVAVLCEIEHQWVNESNQVKDNAINSDPFGQLDLLIEEIQEDCNT